MAHISAGHNLHAGLEVIAADLATFPIFRKTGDRTYSFTRSHCPEVVHDIYDNIYGVPQHHIRCCGFVFCI